jgi:hypothetical protein
MENASNVFLVTTYEHGYFVSAIPRVPPPFRTGGQVIYFPKNSGKRYSENFPQKFTG